MSKFVFDSLNIQAKKELIKRTFYKDGVVSCPYIEDGNITDHLTVIPKNTIEN